MKRSPYLDIPVNNGCVTYNMKSWDDFTNFINKHFLKYSRQYIWRGQENSEWLLESALDRLLKKFKREERPLIRERHLENFRYSIRGRSGSSLVELSDDDICWALGQHYGLATPLLDWTVSPFIAAFFAICNIPYSYPNALIEGLSEKSFTIYALHKYSILEMNKSLNEDIASRALRIIEPLFDGNPRLVSQGGLFTKMPDSTDVESWVMDKFLGQEDLEILIKFVIPYRNIESSRKVLSLLNRMNINHLSLFPDLYGSSLFCNMRLAVPTY